MRELETCARELGVPEAEYRCRVCYAGYPEWSARCDACGSWNAVDLDIRDEQLEPEDLGVVNLPVWGGYDREEKPDRTPSEEPQA